MKKDTIMAEAQEQPKKAKAEKGAKGEKPEAAEKAVEKVLPTPAPRLRKFYNETVARKVGILKLSEKAKGLKQAKVVRLDKGQKTLVHRSCSS